MKQNESFKEKKLIATGMQMLEKKCAHDLFNGDEKKRDDFDGQWFPHENQFWSIDPHPEFCDHQTKMTVWPLIHKFFYNPTSAKN